MESNPEYQKHLNTIKREIPFVDLKPYSHNIIGIQLNIVSDKFGQEYANKIIIDYKLDKLGWSVIPQQKETINS